MSRPEEHRSRRDDRPQDYEIDEPPEKVWRAISDPELRQAWLPDEALADPEAALLVPERQASYRMRDGDPPFLRELVTFQISPDGAGGTRLRVVHRLVDARLGRASRAANSNSPSMMLAA